MYSVLKSIDPLIIILSNLPQIVAFTTLHFIYKRRESPASADTSGPGENQAVYHKLSQLDDLHDSDEMESDYEVEVNTWIMLALQNHERDSQGCQMDTKVEQ